MPQKLTLYRLPEILVLHLKRFSYSTWRRDKLATNVSFKSVGYTARNWGHTLQLDVDSGASWLICSNLSVADVCAANQTLARRSSRM